jgi:hypothetical protein
VNPQNEIKRNDMSYVNYDVHIIEAKTKEKIPVVGGVHLHSVYNPIKEATTLLENNKEKLDKKSYVLVLGLGFAYHVNEIYKHLALTNKKFELVVIEPNNNTTIACVENELIKASEGLTIYSGKKIENLYRHQGFIDFLMQKPCIIQHAPSFNLYIDYFQGLLTYKAPQSVHDVFSEIADKELKGYFSHFHESEQFSQALASQKYEDTAQKEKYHFWNALYWLIKSGEGKGAKP